MFNFSVTLKPQHAEAGFKSAFTEMERIGRYGFTATELDRVKKTYMAGIKALILEKDKNKSANYVEEYVNYFLNQEAAPGLETEFKLTGEFLPGITLAEVNRKTAGFLSLRDQDILVTGPKTIPDDLPDERTLKQWIDEVKKAPLSAYLENNLNAVLMKDEPVKGKVAAVSNVSALNAAIYRLDNGIQLVFKPTTFKNDGVLFYSYKKGGTSLAADPDYHSAVNAAALVKAGGVANLTANQLAKLLSGRKLSVSPYINELYEGFSGSFGAEDMETAFQLIHQYHVSPRKDTTVFKNILANAKIAVANRHNDPEAVFSDSVNAVLGDYSIRRTPPALADIAGIDQDKALRFYRERWDNVNGETFVFVGNFDPEKLLNYCETYLGSLPADTGSAESFKDLKIVVPAGIATHIFNKGKEAKSEVKLVFSGKYDYSLASNLQLQALGAIVELRLLDRLRESEGGVYTPQAGATFAKYPSQQYQIAVDFTCAPGNTDKLIHATLEEIENLKTNGISASDLEKFKAETLRNNEVRVKTDAYWLGYLVRQMSNKEDLLEADQVVTMINALDRDTLQKAAKKYISGDNLQRFILNPEKPN
ncbi:insulinase family protein [Mucilaginibacter sp. P25]|uniref:M16 family metallopeptidase n=1 Tax=Mucilaginibacter sp. P25 TaxID=3423945 RepID=UPI003D7B6DB4